VSKEATISRLQELVYELKVKAAMTEEVITVSSTAKMSDLRAILKDNRISGAPVVSNGGVVGIISVEDFINWLAQESPDCAVEAKMSRDMVTLYQDEPLVHAVSKIEQYGFGRLPVLDRHTKKLVGIITKGDIIEGLLHSLDVAYHEEEIRQYRASHFLEDIIADRISLIFHYHIRDRDISRGGEVASGLKKSLKRLGIHPSTVRRAAIATYEAEMNVIIYAEEGEVTVKIDPGTICIDVGDKGPGIPDVSKALKPGYSTAEDWVRELGFGAGMGLNNIQSCSESLDITSTVGRGTWLHIAIPMEKE
jgi:CBS domain-containing protein/anti-sigma regulatory factor (Ser/Thr protein kinase)